MSIHARHHDTSTTGGTLYSPSRMAAPGRYTRSQSMNLPDGCGQPVGFMACRSGVLDVNVDGAVGVRNETGAITDAVAVDRIWHKVILRVAHGERPECIVRRKLACRKVHDVVVRSGELMACAIDVRRPVHRLLRYVYGLEIIGTRGAQKDAIARLAASENGGPAVDFRDIGVEENVGRDEREHGANNDALHHVRSNGSRTGWIPNSHRAKYERPDKKGADHISEDGAVHRYQNSTSGTERQKLILPHFR